MTYTYRYSHDVTAVQTFVCEGCGKRTPASRLYGRWPLKRDLQRGICHGGKPRYVMHPLTCSHRCLTAIPRRTLAEFYRDVLGVPMPTPALEPRPWTRHAAHDRLVAQGGSLYA